VIVVAALVNCAAAADPEPAGTGTRVSPQDGGMTDVPSPAELEQRNASIRAIHIDVDDIFDKDDPRENGFMYRVANDLHLSTRDGTIREQLLFHPGEPWSAQKAEETARMLRERNYLSEAEVVPTAYDPVTNSVDVTVRVRDVWTLEPGVGVGRAGGENKSRIRLADENFLGLGEEIALEYKSSVDRSGVGIEFRDPNVFNSWWGVGAHYADTSDGSIAAFSLEHPFYSLDSRWSLGFAGQSDDQVTSLYDLGHTVDEFDSAYDSFGVQGGRSRGLVNGWTRRWLAGYRYDRAKFDYTTGGKTPSTAKPEDRLLSYPWVGIELLQDRYQTTHNHDQIGRVEDLNVGMRLLASVGFASPSLGSDRSAGILALEGHLGRLMGEDDTLLVDGGWSGRLESGSTADSLVQANAHWYDDFDEKNLFDISMDAAHAHALDLDQQLQIGGDTGLRGYPLRYQNGDTRALFTVEERYFTDWYPWRLFRVGGAVFADYGRMWGQAPLATEPLGWLGDAGIGLRIGNQRSGIGNVLHIDLAFPIGGPSDIDSMQLLLEAQKSF
jgi:outer membrane protein assembly factor BamA